MLAAGASATGAGLIGAAYAADAPGASKVKKHYFIPANDKTVHWSYFSKSLKPMVEIESGDFVTIEILTHHAGDDFERMIQGDPGAESVYYWDSKRKGVNRRGAGPMDASLFGRGAGEGLGVHICTAPVFIKGAAEGDVLEVRIVDVMPRPCANPKYLGKTFGSNAFAWWGFYFKDMITEPKDREVITIYEVDANAEKKLGTGRVQLSVDTADRHRSV